MDPRIRRAKLNDKTDVVTIAVGGDSLPFGGMLLKCLQLGATPGKSCREYYTSPPVGEESIEDKPAGVQDEYVRMPAKAHEAAPNARVIAVGYQPPRHHRAGRDQAHRHRQPAGTKWIEGICGRPLARQRPGTLLHCAPIDKRVTEPGQLGKACSDLRVNRPSARGRSPGRRRAASGLQHVLAGVNLEEPAIRQGPTNLRHKDC
ncbi:hypothetical protein [Streptomyces misionensis]|uniref:hypothetical protein n=1 Tax=Streptomyces misionensis TaxID=67331 RepID=UPI000A935DA3|nr:hypothetical protein [Streptomyces misionensis]